MSEDKLPEERPRTFVWTIRKGLGDQVIRVPKKLSPYFKLVAIARVQLDVILYHDELLGDNDEEE